MINMVFYDPISDEIFIANAINLYSTLLEVALWQSIGCIYLGEM